MAAPVQTVKCEQKNSAPEQQISTGNSGLKNGTSMEEVNSDQVPGNMLVNSKVKSPNQGREVTMENFQDGGPQHQLNMSSEQSAPFTNIDSPRLNSDLNNYSQNSGDQTAAADVYAKMNDTLNQGQMQPYSGGYNNRANYMAEQHGGAQHSANSDTPPNSQPNHPYAQYNQQNVRPGYPPPSKAISMGPPRPPNTAPAMNMMLGYTNSPTQQRFLSAHSISQQGGPTPTLNQLLQSPNPVHRYHNSYADYNLGQSLTKGPSDMVNTGQYSQTWNTNTARGMNAYSHQMGASAYRNQSGPLDSNQQGTMKRPGQGPYMHPSYTQGQYGSQYSQRYGPPSPQVRAPPMGLGGQNYPQQYNQQHTPQQQQMPGFERPSFMPQASQNFQQQGNRPQSTSAAPTKEGNSDISDISSSTDEVSGDGNQGTGNPGTQTPPVSHSSVPVVRPTLSPSGSSRSMSPAISNQQNIPLPPRPSSQSESGQNRMSHSPMAPQGYNQSMAPPHMTPAMYGNKLHPGMMGGSQQMSSYSPQNQIYPQGSYSRNHQGSIGMQGYGSQPQTYPGSQANSMGQQPYGMNRMGNHMPAAAQGYGGGGGSSGSGGGSASTGSGGGNNVAVEPVSVQDEASQQSTTSNTSNTDERAETPRPRKDVPHSHPPTPASTLPSPGAASMSSFHDEFESVSSPSWPRTPASPVINSQIHEYHPPSSSSKRPDSLNKLYDLSDDPERKGFLDRLMQFNDERGSAITQCPTISKQPLDLYKLYLVVKDRGGFVEVTKLKQWKDVAGQIGIGASSSAAYTLRKQYVKHLLPYECKFDRGGIDPQPIISQLEAATRKKNSSKTNTAPSPAGSSNSQDSFPASNSQSMDGFPTPPAPPFSQYSQSGGVSNSEYAVGPPMMGPLPPGSLPNSDPPPHPNMMPPHNNESINVQNPFADEMQAHQFPRGSGMNSGMPPPGMQNSYGYASGGNIQQRQVPNIVASSMASTYGSSQPMPAQNPPATPYSYNDQMNRPAPINPSNDPYPLAADQYRRGTQMINHDGGGSSGGGASNTGSGASGGYNNRNTPEPYVSSGPNYPPPPGRLQTASSQYGYGPQFDRENAQPLPPREPPVYPPRSYSASPGSQQPGYSGPTDQYRQEQAYPMPSPNQAAESPQAHLTPDSPKKSQCYPSGQPAMYSPSNKMMPPQGYAQGPKRHPDFMKPNDQQYGSAAPFNANSTHQQPGPYSGWRNDTQFGGYGNQVSSHPPPTSMQRDDWVAREQTGQWSPLHQRYPSPGTSHFGNSANLPPHVTANLAGQNSLDSSSSLRQIMMQRMPAGFKAKQQPPYPVQNKMQPVPPMAPNAQYPQKREIIFPMDSIEAISPLLIKRKRMMARDIIPVEAWRLMMALKSGLLCESTWALDVLSILLFDDSTVLYFSLQHLPGLLEVLMEHYRRCLSEVFGMNEEMELAFLNSKQQRGQSQSELETDVVATSERLWYSQNNQLSSSSRDVDLGAVENVDHADRTTVIDGESTSGVVKYHRGKVVKVLNRNDLFISDADKPWDTFEGFSGSSEHWQLGGGDTTLHIQTHFESDRCLVQFVKILSDVVKKEKSVEDDEEDEFLIEKDGGHKLDKGDCLDRTLWDNNKEEMVKKDVSEELSLSQVSSCKTPLNVVLKSEVKVELVEDCSSQPQTQSESSFPPPPSLPPPPPSVILPKSSVVIPASALLPRPRKRRFEDYEDEAYNRDEPSLALITDGQDSLLRRCICISNILRSLSFVPGNDCELSKHPGFLLIMGKLLLLHHNHAIRRQNQRNYDKEEDVDFSDSCSSLHDHEWWWDGLHVLRENTLVTLANIAGQLDLSLYPEEISLPILDGLLHWSVCPAAYAQDPLPTLPAHSVLSPQRLTLEALCKLSVQDSNVDLILATPPFSRIERLFGFLSRSLSKHEDPVVREFSVVLLHYFSQADSVASRVIACQSASVSLLISFVEQAEQNALTIANTHGINMLRENPEMMGTSLDMLRRTANTLLALARVPENRPLFLQHQQRLLNLVMSQILDQHVAAILADVLYECSQASEVLS